MEPSEDSIPIIVVDLSPMGFAIRELVRRQQEINRIPEWLLAADIRLDDPARRECRQRHLFVNALSQFCHICGEAR